GIEMSKRSSSSAITSSTCSESNPRSATRSLASVGSIGRRLTFFSTSMTPSSMAMEAGCGMVEARVRIASGDEETINDLAAFGRRDALRHERLRARHRAHVGFLVIFLVRVDRPEIVALAEEVPHGESRRQHRMVLVVVLVHAVAADQLEVREALGPRAHLR